MEHAAEEAIQHNEDEACTSEHLPILLIHVIKVFEYMQFLFCFGLQVHLVHLVYRVHLYPFKPGPSNGIRSTRFPGHKVQGPFGYRSI